MNRFFGLDGSLSSDARNPVLRLAHAWPLWVTLLVVIAVLALVVWLYRRERPSLTSRKVGFFSFLRVAAWVLLLLMLFEPVLVWDVPIEHSSSLVLILDDSQSMSIADRYQGSDELAHVVRAVWPELKSFTGSDESALSVSQQDQLHAFKRADLVNRVLASDKSPFAGRLSKEFDLETFTASETLQSVSSELDHGKVTIPRIEPRGAVTRLGDLVREAVSRNRGKVSAVVLVSDGAVNAGEDFDSLARYLKGREVKLYAVGVGDSRPPRDIRIRSTDANRVALVNDVVTVKVSLESTGFRGDTAEIKLKRDGLPQSVIFEGREQPAARVLLQEDTIEVDGKSVPKPQDVELAFRADKAGTFRYSVEVTPHPEELVVDNNRAEMPLRVLDQKMKVLYIEGPPRWEYRFLKNALLRDETIDLSCVLTSADFEFAQEGSLPVSYFPSKEADLFAYDVVIIGDVPRADLTDAQHAMIAKLVEKLGGGCIMIAGEQHAPAEYRGTIIEKMLPVDLDRRGLPPDAFSGSSRNKLFKPVLTPEGLSNPETAFVADMEANKRTWESLPGMFWHYPISRAKPGATVLLEHPYARSNFGPEPLLAVQYYGAGKCAFLAVDEMWRWRDRVGDKYESRFWGQMIRDLCQNKFIGKSKRFRVSTSKNEYRLGEKVDLFAQVLDDRFEPVNFPSVDVELTVPGAGKTRLKLGAQSSEPGRFHGEFLPQAPGTYTLHLITGEAELPEEAVTQSFLVTPSLLEFQDVSMNHAGLARLADATGGKFFYLDQVSDLGGALLALKASSVREVTMELWNAPVLFTLFALLFVVELLYRKRCKLL